MEKRSPAVKYNYGTVSVAVWENEHDGKKYNSYTIQKRYKDEKTGEWTNSNSFSAGDLDKLKSIIEFIGVNSVKIFTNAPQAETETQDIDVRDIPF